MTVLPVPLPLITKWYSTTRSVSDTSGKYTLRHKSNSNKNQMDMNISRGAVTMSFAAAAAAFPLFARPFDGHTSIACQPSR